MFETAFGVQTEFMPQNSVLKIDPRLQTYSGGADLLRVVTRAMFDQAVGDKPALIDELSRWRGSSDLQHHDPSHACLHRVDRPREHL